MLQWHISPFLRHVDNSSSVHETITKLVIKHATSSILEPAILIEEWAGVAGHDDEVLHVTPGQTWVGLQSQGTDTSSNGCAGTCACVFSGADLVGSQPSVLTMENMSHSLNDSV